MLLCFWACNLHFNLTVSFVGPWHWRCAHYLRPKIKVVSIFHILSSAYWILLNTLRSIIWLFSFHGIDFQRTLLTMRSFQMISYNCAETAHQASRQNRLNVFVQWLTKGINARVDEITTVAIYLFNSWPNGLRAWRDGRDDLQLGHAENCTT